MIKNLGSKKRESTSRESGLTLVHVLVGIALLSIGALAMSSISARLTATKVKGDAAMDLATMRNLIMTLTDCKATYNPANNPSYLPQTQIRLMSCNGPMRLLRRNGIPIAQDGQFGKWSIRAECADELLHIRYAQLKDPARADRPLNSYTDADFRPDPLSGKPMKWAELLPGGINLCNLRRDSFLAEVSLATLRSLWGENPRRFIELRDCAQVMSDPRSLQALHAMCYRWCAVRDYQVGNATECGGSNTVCMCRL